MPLLIGCVPIVGGDLSNEHWASIKQLKQSLIRTREDVSAITSVVCVVSVITSVVCVVSVITSVVCSECHY